ncbi:MAG: 30S ribosome-binding factor RbfA [Tenuifilaceae bacterium]|jgi:ribosome-binding factor A|uniref:30S ribosome-binding factor RbfA n=1 Tax=Perlabentimonas gracilis TaxID=2715279 RepID=UPI00140BE2E2|nr:30S ribosome-binding factor RbfA [Perlabentimonas gracilis]MDX9769255.1 30S ribosome-binding factor RbfA [Tenuifilaceae bacterium]NHB69025.1 30S ribosome-binding factor RbfA [Perlabentimonas gracilis]
MESTRLSKVSRQIQKDLGEIFQRQAQSFMGKMVTVTSVRVSPDLGLAKVYVSIFPTENKEETLELIKQQSKAIRYDLGQRIRNQMRVVPELAFYIDDSLDYIENIDRLLK